MSTTTYRATPRFFDEYLTRNVKLLAEGDDQSCTGCGEHPGFGVLDGAGSPHCLRCLGYLFGIDQAEEEMVRSIIGAAIAAALGAGASEELVHLAVQDALSERVRVDGDWIA